jgi:hypothetical protein
MSTVNNGPQIVRSGLVLDLDAGNGKSYSTNRFQSYGSGTVTENVTFLLQGTGTFQRVASGTVIGGYTVRPNDVVYSYALGVLGCHYHGNSAPIPAGSYATFSFDYLVTGATTYPITDYLASFEGVASGAIATANSLQNIWQRRSFTSAIISTSGNMNMYLYPGACGSTRLADSGTIYYRNPKVEITNVDTGNSTFNSTSNIGLWYDLSGNGYNGTLTNGPTSNVSNKGNILFDGVTDGQQVTIGSQTINFTSGGTFEMWTKINNVNRNQGFFSMNPGATYINFYSPGATNQKMRWEVIGNSANAFNAINSITTLQNNVWYHVVGNFDTSGGSTRIYINGSLDNSQSSYTNVPSSVTSQIIIGSYGGILDGNIAVAKIYNRVLSASEISQNFQATKTRFGL